MTLQLGIKQKTNKKTLQGTPPISAQQHQRAKKRKNSEEIRGRDAGSEQLSVVVVTSYPSHKVKLAISSKFIKTKISRLGLGIVLAVWLRLCLRSGLK